MNIFTLRVIGLSAYDRHAKELYHATDDMRQQPSQQARTKPDGKKNRLRQKVKDW